MTTGGEAPCGARWGGGRRPARRVSPVVLLVLWLLLARTGPVAAAPWPVGAAGRVDAAAAASAGGTAAASAGGAAAASSAGRWAWPLSAHVVAVPFAAPATRYAAGHRGIDLAASPGAVVTAPAAAVVRFSGVVVDRPVLTLDHGGGVLSSYEPVLSGLPVGSVVGRGAVVGAVASGGHCAQGCLHVGVRVDGAYVSPLLFFDRVPPAVLLPLGGP